MVAGIDRTVTRRPVEKAPPTLELVLKRNSVERIKREKDPLGMLGELPALIAAGYEQVPEEDLVRLKWWGLYHDKPKIGTFMLRIKLPAGRVTPAQLEAIGELSLRYGKGSGELSTRQTIQLHYLELASLPEVEAAPADLRSPARLLRRHRPGRARMTVHLVGAGPGDPCLITARGLELVRSCDVLVHDRLVAAELVAEAPSGALVLCRDGLDQAAVTELLVDSGQLGLDVVRLKGGDPFVFGRGGEEALALQAAGIACEIVPGVSSIAAVPAAAGIPVTHRGISDHVTIASCQGADGGDADYARLAAIGGTLVLFMGLGRVERVVDGLLAAGMPPETPAAAISRGTLPDQEVVRTTLQQLAGAASGLAGPALIVVGDVAALDVASDLQTERLGGAEVAEPERAARHRALAAEPA